MNRRDDRDGGRDSFRQSVIERFEREQSFPHTLERSRRQDAVERDPRTDAPTQVDREIVKKMLKHA